MWLTKSEDLKDVLAAFNSVESAIILKHIIIDAINTNWSDKLLNQLKEIKDDDPLIAIGLNVKHLDDEHRISTILLVCYKPEIDDTFIQEIEKFIAPKKDQLVTILKFLEQIWGKNAQSYPLTFFLTTRTDCNYTLLADRAVAPYYQGKGLMKNASLAIVDRLAAQFGEKHKLMSFPIHPATYRFFNPHDKACSQFQEGSLEEVTCAALIKRHNKVPEMYLTSIGKALQMFWHQSKKVGDDSQKVKGFNLG